MSCVENTDDRSHILAREMARLYPSEYELAGTPAYVQSAPYKVKRDTEFLAMLLDENCDVFAGSVVRNQDGTLDYAIESKKLVARATLGRAQRLLRGYQPTNRTDQQALLVALRRYGLDREARKLKREHDL